MAKGQWQHGLAEADRRLAVGDGALGAADRALIDVVKAAVTEATDAIRVIEDVQAETESADCHGGTPQANSERIRRLLHRQREISAIITRISAQSSAKTIELQQIREQYLSYHG